MGGGSLNLQDWIQLRKKLLKQVKSQVLLQTGMLTDDLKEYSMAYDREFHGAWKVEGWEKLHKKIADSRLVLGGEFHPFSQSQRTHLRILRQCHHGRPIIIALECIESRHQKSLDLYCEGKISDSEFLDQVQWESHWGFPWVNYKPLFEMAKKNQIQVCAINEFHKERNSDSLEKRDHFSARKIVDLLEGHPESLIYVIYGEWHIAKPHLPKKIFDLVPDVEKKTVRIMQNAEKLYFYLAQDGKEATVSLLEGGEGKYCVLGSPPWVQWQSYLMYLERTHDHSYYDDEEDESFEESIDYTDHLHSQLKFLSKGFSLDLKFNDLEVYSPTDENLLESLERRLSKPLLKHADYCIRNDVSFYFPEGQCFYLSRPTVNHLAGLAGKYLQAKLSERKKTLLSMPEFFLQNIWVEAVTFFVSKMVNHQRKSETLDTLKMKIAISEPHDRGHDVLLLALDQRLIEVLFLQGHKVTQRRFKPRRKSVYIEASRILGGMLGERLYLAYRRRTISDSRMIDLISKNVEEEDFDTFYYDVQKEVGVVKDFTQLEGVIYDS